MGLNPDHIIEKNGWQIVQSYEGEKVGNPLFITDLSHAPQWSLQSRHISSILPSDLSVPAGPGEATLEEGVLVVRLLHEECRIMNLGTKDLSFEEPCYTPITDAFASFAVVGPQCLEVLSRLSSVDLERLNQNPLRAAQAPVADVTSLLLHVRREGIEPGLIISAPRSYGRYLLEVFHDSGKVFAMAPAGWKRFQRWLRE
jgi:hypothetical protein